MANMTQWKPVDEARRDILAEVVAINETETVAVADALQRITANDIIAPFNVPGHDNSAMDGYACRLDDVCSGDKTLRVVGAAFAGHSFAGDFAAGECVKIMTGAKLPPATEVIIPQEETQAAASDSVMICANTKRQAGQHIRRAGEDLQAEAIALPARTLCHPADIGLLASLGLQEVALMRRLRVAFFSTGDEIRQAGESLGDSDVYDSNRHTLQAMLTRMGFEAVDFGVIPDDKTQLNKTLKQAAQTSDAIITSGGASVGEADHIRTVLNECGRVYFWKVAMRPGRPLTYGKIGNADFFGLPGNPVSVMVCFYQFVRNALWKRAGRMGEYDIPLFSAVTTTALRKAPGRTEFQRGWLSAAADGKLSVTVTGDQGSGILSSMTRANCFIVLPESSERVNAGDSVSVQPFNGIV